MALKYTAVEKMNPQAKVKKWYAQPNLTGKRSLKELSKDISDVSSLSAGDVQNEIVNLIDQLPKWLVEGGNVKLDGFGTFWLSFSSDSVTTKDEVTANLIKDIYILFEPDSLIKEKIQKTVVTHMS